MKRAILITAIVVFGFNLFAQNTIDVVLTEVEKNNTTLSAYRKSIDAEKIGNKTGLAPQNPEVEFNYLWGNPSAIGNRTDFSIKQSFDFPTAYSYKNQISNLKNEQAELEYKKQRNEVLFQTRVICVKLTYYNALKVELSKRLANAQKVAEAYKAKYSTGDVGILEFNKAQVNLLNVTKEQESNEIERNALLSELTTLNGGNAINFTDSLFSLQTIPADFEQWYAQSEANNPLLQWVKQEIAISEKQVKLNTANSLPKFYGGFMSEKVVGQQFQGVSFGITIPLWENKNTVKYARAQTIAIQSVEADAKQQFYNSMKALHTKVIALQTNVTDYRSKLAIYSNSELLEKAFNKGEISLTEYMYELSLYYESVYKLLEMEMNYNVAHAELNKYQ
jgi:outer membrane protein TolC